MIYGSLPQDLGLIDLSPVEMMFWMYCPISTPQEGIRLPDNLRSFEPLVAAVHNYDWDHFTERYVYLTAKTLWVSGDFIGNRPGWHSDGFGTNDVNYIWYDRAPTEFFEDGFQLPEDCSDAMAQMEDRANGKSIVTYPAKHLLRLTPHVIHRSPVGFEPGMRTFVKVSVSKDRYNLEGNSVNHKLSERWPLLPRQVERNHTATPSAEIAGLSV
ncbi:MAG: hypothetical protein ACSLE1_01910 [Sphingobium sp.]